MDGHITSINEIGQHIGLHVQVNLAGQRLGGEVIAQERWVPGVVIGFEPGYFVMVKLDEPVGGGEGRGFLGRRSKGEDRVTIRDPTFIQALSLEQAHPKGVPTEIVDLARAGKTLQAIKRYRALNGATLDEARAVIERLGG